MERGNRTDEPTRRSLALVSPMEPWHSTPIKKANDGAALASVTEPVGQTASQDSLSVSELNRWQVADGMVQKQRRELQLLITELKDRDRELNDMVLAHQKQFQAWEVDRQRVLTLEQKCSGLESQLQRSNAVVQALTKRLRIAETCQQDSQRALESSRWELCQLGQNQQHFASQCEELQEKNQTLNSTVLKLSSQVGQLQAREEELKAMLKLKDTDMTEATNHILDLTGRYRKLEAVLEECRSQEAKALTEAEEQKRGHREAEKINLRLQDKLREKIAESDAQTEELSRLRKENELLKRELCLLGEEERRKEELLELAQSRKERIEWQLCCLRQICENQQNDLQLLQLNLDSAQEALRCQEDVGSLESQAELSFLDLSCLDLSKSLCLRAEERGATIPGTDARVDADPQQKTQASPPNSTWKPCPNVHSSPTRCLQHLLSESQMMVASLEHKSRCSASLTDSPACVPTHSHCQSGQDGGLQMSSSLPGRPLLVNRWSPGSSWQEQNCQDGGGGVSPISSGKCVVGPLSEDVQEPKLGSAPNTLQ